MLAPVETEGIDLPAVGLGAEADAADTFITDQDRAQAGLVEMFAEDAPRARGLEAADPFEILAHHVDAQRQQRLEVGFAGRAEAPGWDHGPVNGWDQSMRLNERASRNACGHRAMSSQPTVGSRDISSRSARATRFSSGTKPTPPCSGAMRLSRELSRLSPIMK